MGKAKFAVQAEAGQILCINAANHHVAFTGLGLKQEVIHQSQRYALALMSPMNIDRVFDGVLVSWLRPKRAECRKANELLVLIECTSQGPVAPPLVLCPLRDLHQRPRVIVVERCRCFDGVIDDGLQGLSIALGITVSQMHKQSLFQGQVLIQCMNTIY
jgi:hypothetical protein